MFGTTSLATVLGLLASLAHADPLVLPPVIDEAKLDPQVATAAHQAIVTALEGLPPIDDVLSLDAVPTALDATCLTNSRCLERIAIENGAPQMVIARAISQEPPELRLVYYRGGRIVRTTDTELVGGTRGWAQLQAATVEVVTGQAADLPRRGLPVAAAPTLDAHAAEPQLTVAQASSTRTEAWQVTARGGWSHYDAVDFWTGGIEVRRQLTGPLSAIGGVHVYALNRELPPDLQLEHDTARAWTTLFPGHLGVVLRPRIANVRPSLGIDLLVAQFVRDPAAWAIGVRGRLGVDVLLTPSAGVSLDLAAGRWSGRDLGLLQPGLQTSGFLPQLSAGLFLTSP